MGLLLRRFTYRAIVIHYNTSAHTHKYTHAALTKAERDRERKRNQANNFLNLIFIARNEQGDRANGYFDWDECDDEGLKTYTLRAYLAVRRIKMWELQLNTAKLHDG